MVLGGETMGLVLDDPNPVLAWHFNHPRYALDIIPNGDCWVVTMKSGHI